MTFTDAAFALLKSLEGCRLTAYQDQAKVWTVGYGHTGPDVHPGLVWTQAQADAQLAHDLQKFIGGVQSLIAPHQLADYQFSALVIFAYNVGLHGIETSTACKLARDGDIEGVPAALMLWDKIRINGEFVVDDGLVKRRAAECALWRGQMGAAPDPIPVPDSDPASNTTIASAPAPAA